MAHEVTDQTFRAEILDYQGVALVDFWAPWCGPCKMLAPAIEALSQEFQGRVKVAKVNVDENIQTATAYGIRSIPTVLIFKNGQAVDNLVGLRPKEAYVEKLNALIENGA